MINFLQQERETLEQFIPTLDAKLAEIPLMTMESAGNPTIQMFRDLAGTKLLIPQECGGFGVSPLQLIQIQRAIASRSPSLALATTMHHSTVVALVESAEDESVYGLMQMIAAHNLYLASAFAEGSPAKSILTPMLKADRTDGGIVINGSKKPCSLSKSMDFLTASVLVPALEPDQASTLAIVIVPASTPGIEVRPFWHSWVLDGAESEEVVLNNVFVPESSISYLDRTINLGLARGLLWFEALVSSAYLGVASALVERTIIHRKGSPTERASMAIALEGAMAALEGIAYLITLGDASDRSLAKAIFVRHTVQRAIAEVSMQAAEVLGGIAFVTSNEVPYLLAACRGLAYHPPSRISVIPALDNYLAGAALILP